MEQEAHHAGYALAVLIALRRERKLFGQYWEILQYNQILQNELKDRTCHFGNCPQDIKIVLIPDVIRCAIPRARIVNTF